MSRPPVAVLQAPRKSRSLGQGLGSAGRGTTAVMALTVARQGDVVHVCVCMAA